jgi:hypothetical protein
VRSDGFCSVFGSVKLADLSSRDAPRYLAKLARRYGVAFHRPFCPSAPRHTGPAAFGLLYAATDWATHPCYFFLGSFGAAALSFSRVVAP